MLRNADLRALQLPPTNLSFLCGFFKDRVGFVMLWFPSSIISDSGAVPYLCMLKGSFKNDVITGGGGG